MRRHNGRMRVLVVEDDKGIAEGLAAHLARTGHAVDCTDTLAAGWRALSSEPYDVVLLDLGLPDGDGISLLRRLREAAAGRLPDAATPVLIMTARDQVASRIEALDLGADDYLTKPFDPDELAARMRALRRRLAGRAQPTIRHGEIELDPAARTVTKAGQRVELSGREFSVLLALMEARPHVLSRPQIEAKLYNFDSVLESNAIEVHVHRLRRKLGDSLVRTVRGVGYYVPAEPVP
jgi:two-component system OmpR family response regulator/two-component system response regulator QseB